MKCLCKLDIVVREQHKECPVHPQPVPTFDLDVMITMQEERENILAALGEHPDSSIDIPQQIADIRDKGRAHFHVLTQTQENLRNEQRKVRELASETCRLNAQDIKKQVLALFTGLTGLTVEDLDFRKEEPEED